MTTDTRVKLIKRYPNRKLYDTESSAYVTLEDIAGMVKAGRELKIMDHKTGADITNVTMAQIVFEEEKRKKSVLPIGTLKDLIQQRGEAVREFVDRIVHENPLSQAKEDVEERMQTIIKKGETVREESSKFFKDVVSNYAKGIEDIQKRFDDRVREVGDRLSSLPAAIGDIKTVVERLDAIEERLAALEKKSGKSE